MTIVRRLLGLLYAFLWVGGLGAYFFLGGPPPQVAWTAPLFLLTAGLVVLVCVPGRGAAALSAAAVLGFASEVAGVHFGVPFGGYRYTEVLGPRLFGVPLVLTTAWMVLVAYVAGLVGRLEGGRPRWWGPVVGAVWMTAIDLVIDPLAAGPLGYWRWDAKGAYFGVPASNFAGWLLVSLVLLVLVRKVWPDGFRTPRPALRAVGFSIVLFFSALAAGFGLLLPALVGLGLAGVDLWWGRRGGIRAE